MANFLFRGMFYDSIDEVAEWWGVRLDDAVRHHSKGLDVVSGLRVIDYVRAAGRCIPSDNVKVVATPKPGKKDRFRVSRYKKYSAKHIKEDKLKYMK